MNTGLVAMITDALEASKVCMALKKKTLYPNIPVIPSRKIGRNRFFLTAGSFDSVLTVNRTRQTEVMANLKNAAENGPTFLAMNFAAMKVPPQKRAVKISFMYINIEWDDAPKKISSRMPINALTE
jgi:hypothetical protein